MAAQVQIKCRYRRSPRSIDPIFDSCTECIVSFGDAPPQLNVTPVMRVRQRSFNCPPMPVGRRHVVVDSLGLEQRPLVDPDTRGQQQLEMDDDNEGEWVGAAGNESRSIREINGLPPTTPFNPKRENSPLLVREYSNTSRTRSRAHSQTSQSSSRSRSRSRARGMPMMRKQSLGAHAAFNAFADAEIDNGGPDRNRSLTPMRTRACSTEEDVHTESLTLPLVDIVSVDQEVPSTRKRQSSGGSSDFFSSKISDTGSGFLLSPPKPPDSYRSKNALYYRIFVHTSTNGYIEFSFDNTNSHDILMAFLSAHLKPNQLPRKTPNDPIISPSDGALRTVVLTPTKLQQPPQLTRSMSIDSACTLDKLQKKMIRQRLQQETTPLGRIRENLANWMSSIVDCACCQDTTTVAPDPSDKNASKKGIVDESPESKLLKKRGIGGLSFEESSTTLSPQLSFEKSVATNHGST